MTREQQLDLISDLRNVAFKRKPYRQYSAKWDHDHCRGCWATFSEEDVAGFLHEGFATTAEYDEGEDYDWLCPKCFSEFQQEMQWRSVG